MYIAVLLNPTAEFLRRQYHVAIQQIQTVTEVPLKAALLSDCSRMVW